MPSCSEPIWLEGHVYTCNRPSGHTKGHSTVYFPATPVSWLDDKQYAELDRRQAAAAKERRAWASRPLWRVLLGKPPKPEVLDSLDVS